MSPAACKTASRGKKNRKYQCRVLCRKKNIPAVPPMPPPRITARNKAFSGMRHRCFFGTLLVDAHKDESDQIDCGKITQLQIQLHQHYACPFWKRS